MSTWRLAMRNLDRLSDPNHYFENGISEILSVFIMMFTYKVLLLIEMD